MDVGSLTKTLFRIRCFICGRHLTTIASGEQEKRCCGFRVLVLAVEDGVTVKTTPLKELPEIGRTIR